MIADNEKKCQSEIVNKATANENEKRNEKMNEAIFKEEKKICLNVNENFNASFGVLKEMIPEYDGGLFPEVWITQFKSINSVYKANENTVKALLMCKLKGKAQMWLHSKPNFINESADQILNEMKEIFCTKENKLVMRRNFEARKWKYGETFIDYYNEKIMLSNKIGIDDDELIDQIIEGIPDSQLRMQASLQCYSNKMQLLQAFSKIQLKQRQQFQNKNDQANEKENKFRCFNCNSFGHFAAEC